jgi:hypothetical protein
MLPQAEKGRIKMNHFQQTQKNMEGKEVEIEEIVEASGEFLLKLEGGNDQSKMMDFCQAFRGKSLTYRKEGEAFYRILDSINQKIGKVNLYSINDPETGCSIEDCWNNHGLNCFSFGILNGTLMKVYDEEIREAMEKLSKMLIENEIISYGLREVNL